MLLKKQTVWLLTMLSLVVVLSVYYITSPEGQQNELAAVDDNKDDEQAETQTDSKDENGEAASTTSDEDTQIITNAAGDEAFETLRMQLEDKRSKQKEELTATVGSTELPVEDRSKAKEEMDQLSDIEQKEILLETLIKAMDYDDVLVRAQGDQVNITVKSDKQSKTEANKIIQTVRSELGPLHAVVTFQTK